MQAGGRPSRRPPRRGSVPRGLGAGRLAVALRGVGPRPGRGLPSTPLRRWRSSSSRRPAERELLLSMPEQPRPFLVAGAWESHQDEDRTASAEALAQAGPTRCGPPRWCGRKAIPSWSSSPCPIWSNCRHRHRRDRGSWLQIADEYERLAQRGTVMPGMVLQARAQRALLQAQARRRRGRARRALPALEERSRTSSASRRRNRCRPARGGEAALAIYRGYKLRGDAVKALASALSS